MVSAWSLLSPFAFSQSFRVRDIAAGMANSPGPAIIVLLDSVPGDILRIVTELSWDTLLLVVGLAFVAVAVIGNISGKISPGKEGRIAAGLVGTGLVAGGIWYHSVTHGFRVTESMVSTPDSAMGTCPLTVNLQGIVDASGSGDAIYNFEFSSGNASHLQSVTFQKTDSLLVSGVWEVHESLKDAWVRLNVAAPQHKLSRQSNSFSVMCVPNAAAESQPPPPDVVVPNPTATAQPRTGANPAVAPTTVKTSSHVVNDSTDSVALDSVEPKQGTPLKTGQSVTFNISVGYNLVSADSAILSISTAQLRTSPAGCSGGVGELVDAVEVPIMRGKHQAVAHLTWSGDTGVATKGRIYGNGYVSFSPMFWADNNGARGARLDYFGIYGEYCYKFGP
jgi:hypothetical protein